LIKTAKDPNYRNNRRHCCEVRNIHLDDCLSAGSWREFSRDHAADPDGQCQRQHLPAFMNSDPIIETPMRRLLAVRPTRRPVDFKVDVLKPACSSAPSANSAHPQIKLLCVMPFVVAMLSRVTRPFQDSVDAAVGQEFEFHRSPDQFGFANTSAQAVPRIFRG